MNTTATINETAAIEITITVIVKPFCIIDTKLIIINLLSKKASFTKLQDRIFQFPYKASYYPRNTHIKENGLENHKAWPRRQNSVQINLQN